MEKLSELEIESEIKNLYSLGDESTTPVEIHPKWLKHVDRAVHLNLMASERGKVGFLGMPLDVYINNIIQNCGLSASKVFRFFSGEKPSNRWISIGNAIGIERLDLDLMARAQFAHSRIVTTGIRMRAVSDQADIPVMTREEMKEWLDSREIQYNSLEKSELKSFLGIDA